METALLEPGRRHARSERINTIFRVAHSMKGGSATFGFKEIASFTHSLETLLDELRGGRMQVTRPITDMLLKSVDVMREMLRAVQSKQPIDCAKRRRSAVRLEMAIARKDDAPAPAPVVAIPSRRTGIAPPPAAAAPATATSAAACSGAGCSGSGSRARRWVLAYHVRATRSALRARQRSCASAARAVRARRARSACGPRRDCPGCARWTRTSVISPGHSSSKATRRSRRSAKCSTGSMAIATSR